jgi:hypothetical protein
VHVKLEVPSYDGLNILWSVTDISGNANPGVTIEPATMFFNEGESDLSLVLSATSAGLSGYLTGELFGTSSPAYNLVNNRVFFNVNPVIDATAPKIKEFRLEQVNKVNAIIQATVTEASTVYYMYCRVGTKKPTAAEIIGQVKISNAVE